MYNLKIKTIYLFFLHVSTASHKGMASRRNLLKIMVVVCYYLRSEVIALPCLCVQNTCN